MHLLPCEKLSYLLPDVASHQQAEGTYSFHDKIFRRRAYTLKKQQSVEHGRVELGPLCSQHNEEIKYQEYFSEPILIPLKQKMHSGSVS